DAPERGEVRVLHLDVEQRKAGGAKPRDQRREGDLGRVGPRVKHRLAREGPADREPVDATDEIPASAARVPDLAAVRPSELVEAPVPLDQLADDPRALSAGLTAHANDAAEVGVERHLEGVTAQRSLQAP